MDLETIYPHLGQNILFIGWLLGGLVGVLVLLYLWFSLMVFLEDAKGKVHQYRVESRLLLMTLINLFGFKLNPGYGFTFAYSPQQIIAFLDSWWVILFLSYMVIKILAIMIQEFGHGRWFRLLNKQEALERRVW